MGAYQSSPVTECESIDSENSKIRYGASSMQGWRRTQEDALNCCPNFDAETESMLFAVYDGHGGSEVAEYCAKHLPDFLRQLNLYQENKIEESLVEAFIEFDRTLIADDTVNRLKDLAKRPESPVPPNVLRLARSQTMEDDDDDDPDPDCAPVDCDEDETANLLEDACTPIDQVLKKMTNGEVTGPLKSTKKGEKSNSEGQTEINSSTEKSSDKAGSASVAADSGGSGDGPGNSGAGGSGAGSSGSSNNAEGSGTAKMLAKAGGDSDDSSEGEYTGEDATDSDDDEEGEELEEDESEEEEDSEDMEAIRASQELALKFAESEDYLELPGSDSGCTACMALIRGNKLYVANAGDSRCVLSRSGKAIDLSVDHKPEDTTEKNRIDKAGGFVTADGRVNGNLNLSRAIGDHNYKRNKELELKEQMITSLPDIMSETLTAHDDFIIVACDGIWNSLTSQECVDFVKERIERGDKLSQICEDLFHSILADDTVEGDGTGCDNMTCVIIDLQKSSRPDPKNHRTNSTGFDQIVLGDLPVSPHTDEPPAKKSKPHSSAATE